MATFIMLPDGNVLREWDASGGGSSAFSDVDDDNGDTQYIFSDTGGERFQVSLVAPSVAEADIDMSAGITVTIKASASKTLTGNSFDD